MHKLITIYLNDDDEDATTAQEHLSEYLEDGWKVVELLPVGAGAGAGAGGQSKDDGHCYVAAWLTVLLER